MKSRIKKLLPRFILDFYYYAVEFFVALRFGFPGLKLKVIGVTGTKGKSTTVYLLTRILEEGGFKVASLSSIEFRMHKKSRVNDLKMALPGRARLQRFLKEALRTKCDYVVLESSSEGLAQYRAHFIHFVGAIFTNLAPEHIESHGSFERYRAAKGILFRLLKKGFAVFNKDDFNFASFSTIVNKDAKKLFFGKNRFALLKNVDLKLLGEFNQYNALAASTAAKELGVKDEMIKRGLERVSQIPGRLEEINQGQPFRVFVDYAHNPSSLEAVLSALSKLKTGRLILLTGSQGGGRDKWKREEMGKIAASYADIVIIANEDPYQEPPEKIIEDIYQGARRKAKNSNPESVLKILDRKEAIETALKMAKEEDIVIVAGKGSETVMEVKEGKIPWSDRVMVAKVLTELGF